MALRLTEVSVPLLFGTTENRGSSVLERMPIEDVLRMRGVNSEYFEPDHAGFMEDFYRYDGPVAPGTSNSWTLSGAGSSIVSDQSDLGLIRLLTDTPIPSVAQLELQFGPAGGGLRVRNNRIVWLISFIAVRLAANTGAFVGLGTPGTADVFTALPTDGIFFFKADTSLRWEFHVRRAGTSTIITDPIGADMANGNQTVGFHSLGRNFSAFGSRNVETFIQNVIVPITDPNIPPDTNPLSMYWAVQRSAAGDARMDIDYVYWGSQDID